MKKIILPLMMLLVFASCKQDKNNPKEPADSNRAFFYPEMSGCIDAPPSADANIMCLRLVFATEGVSFFGEEPRGNGKVFILDILTDKVDASTLFPATGKYTVSSSMKAKTVYTSSICWEMVNGENTSGLGYISGGSMTISGNASNCTVSLNFDGLGEYIYEGPMSLTDKRTSFPMNFCRDYSSYIAAPGDYSGLYSHYLCYTFTTQSATVDSEGYVHGDGEIFQIIFFASSVNSSTFFPSTGTYSVSSSQSSWTVLAGYNSNGSVEGSAVYTIVNGNITNKAPVTSGSMSISGNANSSTVSLKNINKDGHTYTYNGAIKVSDDRPKPEDNYKYEPKTRTTINITSSSADLVDYRPEYIDAVIQFTGTNGMFGHIYLYPGDNLYRYYTVGKDPDDTRDGTIQYSSGCYDNSVYATFFGFKDEQGYIVIDDGIYFVVGGSMTISKSGNNRYSAAGTLTTYYGSTISVNISGNVVQGSANAPRHERIARPRTIKLERIRHD